MAPKQGNLLVFIVKAAIVSRICTSMPNQSSTATEDSDDKKVARETGPHDAHVHLEIAKAEELGESISSESISMHSFP